MGVETTERKWKVEEAARTLIKAEEIKKDKELFSAAIKEIKRQRDAATNALKLSPTEKIKQGLQKQQN